MMKVLLTGATGFTGSQVVRKLLERGCSVRCLVRRSSDLRSLEGLGVETVYGDLADSGALMTALKGVDGLVNVASLGFGHCDTLVDCSEASGIRRAIFVSTTGIFTQLNPSSKTVRLAAERRIQDSKLEWTIIRPTMIYGSSRDRNMCRLARFLRKSPICPIVGSGEWLQQPVFVEDLADAIVAGFLSGAALKQCYNISGADALTFNLVVDTVAALLGRTVTKIHLPIGPIVWGLQRCESLGLKLPVKAEQIQRLNEHKAFSHLAAQQDFGYRPRTFHSGMQAELSEMGFLPTRTH